MKRVLVCGAGGFIGSHLVRKLKSEGCYVVGVDLKSPEFSSTKADQFYLHDLRNYELVESILRENAEFNEIYQMAADMGGASYIFTGEHDADIMHNSAQINLNILHILAIRKWKGRIFYSSSACMYPQQIQEATDNKGLKESDGYPGNPDSEYGWEKLFSERLYLSYARNYGLDVRIARFHNIFGPEGTYKGGKEKAPAAICRKVAEVESGDTIEIFGDGEQTRSFLYIDECLEGVSRLMQSNCKEPINIGSNQRVSINELVEIVCRLSGKQTIFIKHIDGPQGVRGRNSDNTLILEKLGWAPSDPLHLGLASLYEWIKKEIRQSKEVAKW